MALNCSSRSPMLPIPGVPGTDDTIHQCSGSINHELPHYCGCGHEWSPAVLHPASWEAIVGIRILDADGWGRTVKHWPVREWDESITREEFNARAAISTTDHRTY